MNLNIRSYIATVSLLLCILSSSVYGQTVDELAKEELEERIRAAFNLVFKLEKSNLAYYKFRVLEVENNTYGGRGNDIAKIKVSWKTFDSEYVSVVFGDMTFDEEWCLFKFKITNSSNDINSYQTYKEINLCDNTTKIPSFGGSLDPQGSMGTGKGYKGIRSKSRHSDN